MAQKVHVVLVDDLDGGEATETLRFAFDGVSYEIDLSAANAATLRDQIAPWAKAARKVSGKPSPKAKVTNSDTSKVRAWAKAHGYAVSERGRIPADIRAAYEVAN